MKKIFEFFASPEDVELKVTNKIEDDLESITGIERITSTSLENISVINVTIDINAKDLEEAKTDIKDAVVRVTDFFPFESYTSEKNVVTFAQFENPIETGEVIVMSNFEGPVIKVKDLAVIRDDFEDESLIARIDGKDAISSLAYKIENADIIRTVLEIRWFIRLMRTLFYELQISSA